MMDMKLIPVLGLVLLSGCGMLDRFGRDPQLEGQTRIRISQTQDEGPAASFVPVLGGGLMIILDGVSGPSLGLTVPDEADRTFLVPNGTYRIFAFSYTTPGFGDGGLMKCGKGDSGADILLTGGTRTVQIELRDTTCTDFLSSSYSSAAEPKPLRLMTCAPTAFPSPGGPSACSSTGQGSAGSARVIIPNFFRANGNVTLNTPRMGDAGCMPFTSGTVLTNYKIPVGLPTQSPVFPVLIETFAGASCAGSPLGRYVFEKGILDAANVKAKSFDGTMNGAAFIQAPSAVVELYLRNFI